MPIFEGSGIARTRNSAKRLYLNAIEEEEEGALSTRMEH
jgi:hypothetical protein